MCLLRGVSDTAHGPIPVGGSCAPRRAAVLVRAGRHRKELPAPRYSPTPRRTAHIIKGLLYMLTAGWQQEVVPENGSQILLSAGLQAPRLDLVTPEPHAM
jgi:hypothetical protein